MLDFLIVSSENSAVLRHLLLQRNCDIYFFIVSFPHIHEVTSNV